MDKVIGMSLLLYAMNWKFEIRVWGKNLSFAHVLVNGSLNGQLVTIWLYFMRNWSDLGQ